MKELRQFYQDTSGNATEYILIVTIVSLAIFAGSVFLATGIAGLFDKVNGAFPK